MKNGIFVLIIFLGEIIFPCCDKKIKPKSEFRSIEYSHYGQLGHGSIKIDSTGIFFLQKSFRSAEDSCYTGSLPDSILVRINNIVDKIKKSHLDTLYSIDCKDCSRYCYVIDADSFYLKTIVRGGETDPLLNQLNKNISLIAFDELKLKKVKIDTVIVFKSSFIPTLRNWQDSSISK
jgi:hypothetical protein